MSPRSGDRVLELAAGPGSLGGLWAELVGSAGTVVLSDIAPGMVEVARRRNAHSTTSTSHCSTRRPSIDPDNSFDVVACRMGLMFTPDPAISFAEIHRVLDTSGRIGMLTWAGMEHNPWMTCVGMAAMMNGLVSGGPPIGPGGIFSLDDPAELEMLAKGAGFVDVVTDEIEILFHADSVDAHIERVGALAGPLAATLQAAKPDQQAAVLRTAADLAAPYITDHGVHIPGRAVLLTGHA